MTDARGLLPEDIEIVERQGAPVELAEHYVVIGARRSAVLTVRGIALYRYALNRYGIAYDLAAIQTVKDVTALNRLLVDARTLELAAGLRKALSTGEVGARERDFARQALEGTIDDLDEAGRRYQSCLEGGDSVHPFPLKANNRAQ